ncbi:reverse transcriptase domain-containing protein [Thiolapillus sp.]|uniref:reverse transcriptase domain-containing protein n=1 Tax=Thiolapillus sp. TaxID=2017437 RepID=UPI003AF5CB3B
MEVSWSRQHPSRAGGEDVITALTTICNRIWQTGEWPTQSRADLQPTQICEKYLQHQQDLYHVFIDFKKAFDRVWHAALWATMKKYNISTNLIQVIKNLYNKATSAVLFNAA